MESRIQSHRWILCLCLFIVTVAAGGCHKSDPSEIEMPQMELSVRYGFNQTALFQRHNPVTVTVQNHGEGFSGVLRCSTSYNGRDSMTYEEAITVSAGGTKEAGLSFYTDTYIPDITVELLDSRGTMKARRRIELAYGSQESLYIGVLSNGGGDQEEIAGLKGEGRKVMTLSPGQLPSSFTGLDMLDVLIVDDIESSEPEQEQIEAINQWVLRGGTLVLKGSGAEKRIFCMLFGLPEQAFSSMGTAGIEKAEVGKGAVLLLPLGLKEAGLGDAIADNISETVRIIKEENGGYSRQMGSLEEVLWFGDKKMIPSAGKYGLVIGGYILLVGPGLYLLLKKKDKRTCYWVLVLLMSGCFSIIIYAMGTNTRRIAPSARYVSCLTATENGEWIGEESWLSVITPGKQQYGLMVDKELEFYPYGNYGYYYNTNEGKPKESGILAKKEEDGTRLEFKDCASLRPVYLHSERALEGRLSFRQQLRLEAFQLTGSFTNNTGMDISEAFVLKDNVLTCLGDIPNGETVVASGKESVKLHASWELYDNDGETAGLLEYGTGGSGRENGRFYVLQEYLNREYATGKESFLVGFVDSSAPGRILKKGPADFEGNTLLALSLEIPGFYEGKEAVSDILSYPHTVDEDYRVGVNNRFLTEDEATITYQLGKDCIEALYYLSEWNRECGEDTADPELSTCFYGKISIYNWKKESFEPLFTGGEPGERKLAPENLSGNNELTLKFTPDKVENRKAPFSIPIISALKGVE